MIRFLLSASLLLAPGSAMAQSFAAPIANISFKTPSVAILKDGTRIEGTIPAYMGSNGGMVSFTILDGDGVKHKLKAADVQELQHEPGVLARLAATTDIASNKFQALRSIDKYKDIMNTKVVYYRQVKLPGKGKEALVQQLNVGFDSGIAVFVDTTDSGNEVMGQAVTVASFLISKKGAQSFQIKKVKYKKDFFEIFADCPEVLEMEEGNNKPDFDALAAHVLMYDASCSD